MCLPLESLFSSPTRAVADGSIPESEDERASIGERYSVANMLPAARQQYKDYVAQLMQLHATVRLVSS